MNLPCFSNNRNISDFVQGGGAALYWHLYPLKMPNQKMQRLELGLNIFKVQRYFQSRGQILQSKKEKNIILYWLFLKKGHKVDPGAVRTLCTPPLDPSSIAL